ncbi:WD domain-containing protein [Dendryphion nanum]|uniref:WD domain-containing protein n=1 Tax=Dendryphion nanum TaxID=256645 RepID=A0A9P9IKS7_9PLEO|nr:WD domain-containing protein [Dendryphion nanum]
MSAAAILATLADSRPTTSHEEYEHDHIEEMDSDHQTGGIALDMGHAEFLEPEPLHDDPILPPMSTGSNAGSALFDDDDNDDDDDDDDILPPMSSMSHPGSTVFEHILNHNPGLAYGFAPPPAFPYSTPSLQDILSEFDFETMFTNPHDDYLMVPGKDTFLTVTHFFRNFMPHKDTPLGLELSHVPDSINRSDLRGEECDMQGIDWALRHTTRSTVRAKRNAFEKNRLNPHILAIRQHINSTPNTENYFSFKRINTTHQAFIPHFQLRNLMASTSRNDIFYADRDRVMHTDASGSPASTIMNLNKEMTESGRFQITTLAASDHVLMAGGLEGEYAVTNLAGAEGSPMTIGRIHNRLRESKSHITNQIHLFKSRTTYAPQAVLCSNDNRLRILDVHSNTFTHCFPYSQAVNCSSTSPDGRMRVVVGDFRETLITNSETGRPFEALKAHTDDVFACDWADDGIHVATAAQDSTIVVWDARNWSRALHVMQSQLSVPRILRFSPVGSGPRVLISAEADDFVNVINAQTFESRQLFDFFGRVGGISMTPDGSSLFVANSEPHFGGIMEFERCGWGEKRFGHYDDPYEYDTPIDWDTEGRLDDDRRVVCGWHERERRGLDLGSLII